MDAYRKKKWLADLRSGRYRQGTGTLKADKNKKAYYCCLGVLADGARGTKWTQPSKETNPGCYRLGRSYGALSRRLLRKFGLSEIAQDSLITMNDASGYSFKKIANWIEKNL